MKQVVEKSKVQQNKERIAKWGSNWRELDLGIEKEELVVARALEAITEYHEGL